MAGIATVIVWFADIVSLRIVRKIKQPFALWFARRAMRLAVMLFCACVLFVVTYWVLYGAFRIVRQIGKLVA